MTITFCSFTARKKTQRNLRFVPDPGKVFCFAVLCNERLSKLVAQQNCEKVKLWRTKQAENLLVIKLWKTVIIILKQPKLAGNQTLENHKYNSKAARQLASNQSVGTTYVPMSSQIFFVCVGGSDAPL
jgi:hypothetical protein